ncbi:MAG: alpha/beta fold hydrolase [Anaerolineae bacterium]|nr:alpha/beta fold hydrolase [Anaerolineae bacterium]
MKLPLGLFWLVILLVLSIQPIAAQSTSVFDAADCPFAVYYKRHVECGFLTVPENYAQPNDRQIRLAVAILRNPSTDTEADPIIFLAGGPGQGVVEFAGFNFARRYDPFFETNRDIIIFDQRGVGLSEPSLDCPEYPDFLLDLFDLEIEGQSMTRSESNLQQQASLIACGENLAAQYDLSQYNSAASARDIEELRVALGYEQVNLWSVSYGTRLALTMMRDYPDSIRSVILDSTYPLEVNLFTDTATNWTRALNTVFDACASDERCNAAYPNLRDTFLALVDDLNENPVQISTINGNRDESIENVVLDGVLFQELNFGILYNSHRIPFLPEAIVNASEGNFGFYHSAISDSLTVYNYLSMGMYYAVQCQEEIAFLERGAIRAAYEAQPELQVLVANGATHESDFEICASFDAGVSAAIENEAVTSDIPTLILAGRFDPVTPPQWGRRVHDSLSNSAYVEFPTLAHDVIYADGCAERIAINFFIFPHNDT